ncbi:MAG: hypothetical protein OEZ58_19245 [Gammaproteobacteria bacterium]|nr:hypothetical protein [Gammaproteobacteria bacterium]MDH5731125.1 hypothetical protein [Gammaproteobacteria bacterium]
MTTLDVTNQFPIAEIAKTRGAIYMLDVAADYGLVNCFFEWRNNGLVENALYEFVMALVQSCEDQTHRFVTEAQLMDMASLSRASVLRRCASLIELNAMEKFLVKIPGTRSRTCYKLRSQQDFEAPKAHAMVTAHPLSLPVPSEAVTSQNHELDLYSLNRLTPESLWDHTKTPFIKGELLAVYTLVAALPMGTKYSKYHDQPYEVPIKLGNDYLILKVRPTADTRNPTVSDIKPLMALITIIIKRLNHSDDNPTYFDINMDDIVKVLHRGDKAAIAKKGGSYKAKVLESINRWESTGFKISGISNGVANKFHGVIELAEFFRLITKLRVLNFVGSKGKTPEMIRVYLDADFQERLRNKNFLVSTHYEVLDSDEMGMMFNFWCRRAVKRNHQVCSFTWEQFHSQMSPLRPFGQFNRAFKEFFEKHLLPDGIAKFLGYYFHYEPLKNEQGRLVKGKGMLHCWADENDRLLGSQSFYSQQQKLNDKKQKEHVRIPEFLQD